MKLLISLCLIALALSACNQGPAEQKGKQIDNSIEKVQDRLQNKGPAQKTGEKLDDVVGN